MYDLNICWYMHDFLLLFEGVLSIMDVVLDDYCSSFGCAFI